MANPGPFHVRLNRNILLCLPTKRFGTKGDIVKNVSDALGSRIVATGNGDRLTETDLETISATSKK